MSACTARRVWPVIVSALALAAAPADASTFTVPGDFMTIQEALDACTSGDVVEVGDGIWAGPDNTDLHFSDETITLRSASGNPLFCIIDAQFTTRAFNITNHEVAQVTIEGFMIRNGWSMSDGGAIYIDQASPIFRDCWIQTSFAEFRGGGAYVSSGAPEFIDCVFGSNSALDDGGGLFNDHGNPTFTGCVFDENTAYDAGGAIYSISELDFTILQSAFEFNSARFGGAIYHTRAPAVGTITVDGCDFVANENPATVSGKGGAIYVSESALVLVDSFFDSNEASGDGGAIVLSGSLTADNTEFDTNDAAGRGGAIALELASATFTGCLFDRNDALDATIGGGAVYITESDATFTACDFTFNTAQYFGGAIYHTDGTLDLVSCSFGQNSTQIYQGGPDEGGGAIANRMYGDL
ncbi:MAG: right-handed parallel beta-helix repeat-containing protein, partial [Planctomycetota bacterium]